MSKRSGLAVVLATTLPAIVLSAVAIPMASGASDPAPVDSASKYDPDNVTGISKFTEICLEGNRKFLAGDLAGALESYKAALRLSPRNPFGFYLLSETHIQMNNLAEAEASLRQAEQLSDRRTALLRSKVLFLIADLKERQQKWGEARAAWQAYQEWILKWVDGGGTFPLSAAARVRATDDAMRRDQAYAIVRERIDAAASGNVFNELPAPGKGAAPKR